MPISRGSDLPAQPPPQRQSPRVPLHLKTANPDSNGSQVNPRRSTRSPLHERKKGTRVADLETKLGHVQDELRKLKEQLVSAETAKRDAQQELEDTKKMIPPSSADEDPVEDDDPHGTADKDREQQLNTVEEDNLQVPSGQNDPVLIEESGITTVVEEEETAGRLEAKLEEKVKELEQCLAENASLKKQLEEAAAKAAAAWTREEETALKLVRVVEELAESKAKAEQLEEQLEAADGSRSSLETEMRKLKVQVDQWRKAADAAVTVLSDTGGIAGRGGGGGAAVDFGGFPGSPLIGGESEDWLGGSKRKSGGIRALGDIWKKRGQQK
ncbi:unnamed protein product [Spirodela intermedia]|uniref:Uncharacterized protein n=1 Tax=Spirodela intermedia TaxID=51605 RepID=A0A7I8J844_SPIIN|nr:unnamed protein product [Spirodela intermedia]CAA6665603.1 unnamed protein product [Spirodela intermedia]